MASAPPPSGSTTGSTVSDTIRSNIASTYASLSTLLSLPVLIIITIAALDHADKGLLASSFPMLEKQLGMGVKTLGYFSLFTNLSYSLSLPLWGWAVHRYGIVNAPTILAASCLLWGVSCMCIAASESVLGQAFFRSINGSALSSILPLSQTLLVQVVPNPGLHGRAFGCKSVPNALLCCRMHRNACVHVYFTPVLVVLFFSKHVAYVIQHPSSKLLS